MQARFVQEGNVVDHVVASAVAPGDVIVIGRRVGVAVGAKTAAEIAAGDTKVSVAVRGVYRLPLVGSLVIAEGDALYWDADGNPYGGTAGTGCVTKTATDLFCGFATLAAASNAGTVDCDLQAIADDYVAGS